MHSGNFGWPQTNLSKLEAKNSEEKNEAYDKSAYPQNGPNHNVITIITRQNLYQNAKILLFCVAI